MPCCIALGVRNPWVQTTGCSHSHARPISSQVVLDRLNRATERVSAAGSVPHDMCRTFITLLLEASADRYFVSQLALHPSVDTM